MTSSGSIATAFAVLLLTSVSRAALAVPATALPDTPVWAQAHSDLAPDPAVRFGILPNGMRYAIMRNATPAGQTALRLRVGSGSLEESDSEQGLAHVLEHMAFRGSTHVAADEMIKILERKGLAFGPDTNAATEWTQTVYMLDLPRSDDDTVGAGLMLMRETAGNLTLDPKLLAIERGVVLSEERLRDTPDYRAEKAQIDLFLHGQLAARRFPIGTVEVVSKTPVEVVKAFYHANYRPERTTLIAVGDFDPAAMEARVRATFGDWRGVGPTRAPPDLGHVEPRGAVVKLVRQPGAATRAVVAWARPYDAAPDTAAKERGQTIEAVGLAILNRRFAAMAQGANPPFLGAGASFQNLFRSAKLAVVEATSPPDRWRESLTAVEREVRRLAVRGGSQAELDREIVENRATLRNALAGASTRPTTALASSLVQTVDEYQVFTTPAQDLAVFESATKDLKIETVNKALRDIFSGAGPLVEVATPDAIPGGEAVVKAAFEAARAEPITSRAAEAGVTWPYQSFGAPGTVVSRDVVGEFGVTTVRFANNVRLLVKPTALRRDQILVSVDVGGGRLELPVDHPAQEWTATALIGGGFGKISYEDSQRALAGKLYGVSFAIGNEAFEFRGVTRPEDLATQLQVMAAYTADPGFRPEAFERARMGLISVLPQMSATPDGVFGREAGTLLTRGDPRFGFPTEAAIRSATVDDLKALVGPALATGRVDITIVGDVTVDQAIALTAATFGALPQRRQPTTPSPAALAVRPPAPTAQPIRLTDTGRPDQAVAAIAWPAPDFFADMKRARAVMIAAEILGNRLTEKVRMGQGATYSPETQANLSQVFPGYGYALSMVEMPPASIPGFYDTVSAIARDIADHGVTAAELERARNPRLAGLKKSQQTNEYWLANLTGALSDPRRYALIRSTFPDYEALTLADIQEATRAVFHDDAAWKLIISAAAEVSARRDPS
jgi:zinc protease